MISLQLGQGKVSGLASKVCSLLESDWNELHTIDFYGELSVHLDLLFRFEPRQIESQQLQSAIKRISDAV